ncbi:MAG: PEGA domain-containing protein [Acidobacteriota bacterium]
MRATGAGLLTPSFRVALATAVGAALMLAAAGGVQAAEDTFALQLLKAGESELRELRYAEAIAYLSEALKLAGSSGSSRERGIVSRAHELRALAHMNLGNVPAAEKDFSVLVEIDPTHDLDRGLTSPKILAVFDRVRNRRTGLVTLRCEPGDCRVSLGPQMVEILAPIMEQRVRAGQYHVRIERQGFETVEETWTVEPGQRLERIVRLVQNSQSYRVMTIPPGATVLLDGVEIGITRGPAPPEYLQRAHQEGVTLAELSAPLLIPYVAVGKHELRIEQRCHQAARFALEVRPDLRSTEPITFKPVKLKAQLATLEVRGRLKGGEVLLDGQSIGSLPLRREGLCAGTHRLEVIFPTGARWYDTIELPAGRAYHVQAEPRPTLTFLGMVQVGSQVGADRRDVEAKLVEHLDRLRSFNVARRDRSESERKTWVSLVGEGPIETSRGNLLATRLGAWVTAQPEEQRTDLYLGAVLRRRGQIDEVELYLSSTLGGPAEARQAEVGSGAVASFFSRMDRPIRIEETWAGWTAVDGPGGGPPVLAAVSVHGAAGRVGLRPGDRIVAVDDEPAGNAPGLRRLLEAVAPGEAVRITRLSPDGERSVVTMAPMARPLLLPLEHPLVLYHAAHAHLQHVLLKGADAATSRLAAVNLAVVMLHFGRAQEALTSYLEPRAGGVLEPIVRYWRARAYEFLGENASARSELQAASARPFPELEPPNLPVSILAPEALGRSRPR